MQGKILIVDAIATNRIVLKVKLRSAYYNVIQAASLSEALAMAAEELPDLVIAAMALPDGDAAALCAGLRGQPDTGHIPIIAIGNQPGAEARMRTLEAGVHDVLAQPVDQTLLLGRVRSLIRAHHAAAEWQMREDTCRALGLAEPATAFDGRATCLLVGEDRADLQRQATRLRPILRATLQIAAPREVMQLLAGERVPDVIVLAIPEAAAAALEVLRLIPALQASAQARQAGVIVLQRQPDPALGAHALDLGADDLMTDGFDAAELALRIRAVMRRRRMSEQLRATVRTGLQAAVFDPLTGLYNRRYAMPHLERIAAHARATGRKFAVLAADLDHFKRINDAYGHASGDAMLVEVAHRLRRALRSTDMVARIGGEEFMAILSGISREEAQQTALRICNDIAARPFTLPGSPRPVSVTISVGMAINTGETWAEEEAEAVGRAMLDQADRALYAAKGSGRNRVTLGRPAA